MGGFFFGEGLIAMGSRYCPVRIYNKDKAEKYRVYFFILADAKYDFIYHIDMYHGKNTENIDIHPSLHNLPTTQKAFENAIIKSVIENDPRGYRHIYVNNRYASLQQFPIMGSNYNLREVGTRISNRKGYDSEQLLLD